MGELIFILGGAGSGKSKFAVELAGRGGPRVAFVATCDAGDQEMRKKIRNHQKERPAHWPTIEAGATPFQVCWPNGKTDCLLVDSLTLWVSALLMLNLKQKEILERSEKFFREARAKFRRTIVVSDEVGFSLVPENRLARNFRELLGKVNQQAAGLAGQAFLVAAGLPIQLKRKNTRRSK